MRPKLAIGTSPISLTLHDLKKAPGERFEEQALRQGQAQLRAQDDGAELRAVGADPVRLVAAVCDEKRVLVG